MPIQFVAQPANNTSTLVFDAGAETRNMSRFSNAAWTFFSTGVDSMLDAGVGFKLADQPFDPWANVFAAYDLRGGSGNDLLNLVGAGADRLDGGAGDDTISGAAGGADTLVGGAGRDLLVWSLAGLAGPVALDVRQASVALGDARASGFELYDLTLTAGPDSVDLRGLAQSITDSRINGSAGDDAFWLDHSSGNLNINGGDGNDVVSVSRNDAAPAYWVSFSGGDGDDTLAITVGPRTTGFTTWFNPGAGHDTLIVDASLVTARLYFEAQGAGHKIIAMSRLKIGDNIYIELPPMPTRWGGPTPPVDVTRMAETVIIKGGSANDDLNVPYGEYSATRYELWGGAGNDSLAGVGLNDTLHGESGHDRLSGGHGNDSLSGGDGNDTLVGGEGNDTLLGGDGDDSLGDGGRSSEGDADLLDGGTGNDTLQGGGPFPNDTLLGGSGDDWLSSALVMDGGDGFDVADFSSVNAGFAATRPDSGEMLIPITPLVSVSTPSGWSLVPGNITYTVRLSGMEYLVGGSGNDSLTGNGSNDSLIGGGGDDLLLGLDGADTLEGGNGNDRLEGGQGDDALVLPSPSSWSGDGLPGVNTLDGGAGQDRLVWRFSAPATIDLAISATQTVAVYSVYSSWPSFTITSRELKAVLVDIEDAIGGMSADTLLGSALANMLNGAGANDSLNGRAGHDTLQGDDGDDSLFGEAGDDLLQGGIGADSLLGAEGNDVLEGGAGNDTLSGGDGNDTISGNAGDDLVLGGAGDDMLILGTGAQSLDGGAGRDIADFGGASVPLALSLGGSGMLINADGRYTLASIEGLSGTRFNDTLFGDPGANLLAGAAGRDILLGGDGNDTLLGGEGRDTLSGWFGTNQADGGAGIDTLHLIGARRGGTLTLTPEAGLSLGGSFANARETTSFTGIETLVFTDGRLVLDPTDPAMQVVRLYETALARAPNGFELNFWVDRLGEGMGITRAGEIFAGGVEFAARWGNLSAADFVARVYANSAGRAANEFEQSFWTAQLNAGMSRGDVLTRLSEYHEAQEVIGARYSSGIWDQDEAASSIARLYQAALGRRPDEPGFVHWKLSLDGGMALSEVARMFVGSPEFQARYGAPDNAGFVSLLYNNVLGRAPDADGFAFWTNVLNGGTARAQVVLGFAESQEFKLASMGWIEGGIVFA